MSVLFSKVLNMSLTASVIILCVMAARLLLKKAPKIYSYALWAVVLFRLLCPVSLSAPVSVLDLTDPEVTASQGVTSTVSFIPEQAPRETLTRVSREEGEAAKIITLPEQKQSLELMDIASIIWRMGVGLMGLYSLMTCARLRIRLVGAMPYQGNVYLADYINSPFVLGILRPKIYLPSNTPREERRYIIAHERHHIRRWDHIVKLLAYAALCVHWFNPLVWAAFILAGKDMEMSCDEAVIKKLGSEIRADYSASLLRLATHRTIISGTPLAFGEGDTKGRVLNMAKWKKPKVWVSILCLILCVVLLTVCAVNPEEARSLGDMTRISGPAEAGFGNLYFTLPEGYTYELIEEQTSSTTLYCTIIKAGDTVVGGVRAWDKPNLLLKRSYTGKSGYVEGNSAEWVRAVGLPEAQENPDITVMVSDSRENKYIEAVFRNAEDPALMDEHHYLFLEKDLVYDMWFERNHISESESLKFLETIYYEDNLIYHFHPRNVDGATYRVISAKMPGGYICERDWLGNAVFTDGYRTVGGVQVYAIPEGVYDPEDGRWFWLEQMDIPDYHDPDLIYSGGITSGEDGWHALFISNVPAGAEITVERGHVFRVRDGFLYDIWVDELLVTKRETVTGLYHAVAVGAESETSAQTQTDVDAGYSLKYTMPEMPEGITYDQQKDTVQFFSGGKTIGGIDHYGVPEWAGDSYDPYSDWEKLDIPDVKDETLCHMGGSSDFGDWDVHYESDVLPGTEKTVDRLHTFFVVGEELYDIWFDMMQINNTTRKEILLALTGEEEPLPEMTAPSYEATIPSNGVKYQDSFLSDDGTVTIYIDTYLVPEEFEVESGASLDNMLTAMELEFKSSNVDRYGLDTTAMGHVGAKCEINVTRILPGDYLISETEAVPTMEVYGTRKYIFANGDELGEEMGDIHLMTINARNCETLNVFGRKN